VGVHPDRTRSAAQVLATHQVDLFVLDDGFQTRLRRDVDLVLLDALLDPPFVRHRGPLRESVVALERASALGVFTGEESECGALPEECAAGATSLSAIPHFHLRRVFGGLRRLSDGGVVAPPDRPLEVLTATAVGQPESVLTLLTKAKIQASHSLKLKDHARPSPWQIRRLRSSPAPVLMTEKDALSWGRQSLDEGLVLALKLEGAEALARWAITELGL
jgi:tetraacyldisaccharide-1-P 4'-kinase